MKRSIIRLSLIPAISALALTVGSSARADTIGLWTFEAGQPSALSSSLSVTATSYGPIASDVGVGSAHGTHASTATVFSSPVGDGSLRSFSANGWAQGDYFQFQENLDQVNGIYSGISVSFDQNGSATGPKTFYFAYSTDGTSWTPFGSDYALTSAVTWSSTVSGQPTHESFDLSSITALDTANTIYFRVVEDSLATGGAINGGNIGTAGTDRIDNFSITATVVPEPASAVVLGGFGLLLAWNVIRRRS